jgi:hypothetical protein
MNSDFSFLNGNWYLYWVTINPGNADQPVWAHGVCEFTVLGTQCKGQVELINHPKGKITFQQNGEIRSGSMYLVDTCSEEPSDYSLILYPLIINTEKLLGVWSGFDNLSRPIIGPNVMSRIPLQRDSLDAISTEFAIRYLLPGSYPTSF